VAALPFTGPTTAPGTIAEQPPPTDLPVLADSFAFRAPPAPSFVFPVDGKHEIGMETSQRFGGARDHEGQDIFAGCGTPVVSASDGTVVRADYEGGAGNYLVVERASGRSNVYMHLKQPARMKEGDPVVAGEPIGRVGQTGDADGCHLHFEQWTAPGWFKGEAVDPYRELRTWEIEARRTGSSGWSSARGSRRGTARARRARAVVR
jgi:murein DD-endopeptidase MepM/ murein hydrolase activator NlpD